MECVLQENTISISKFVVFGPSDDTSSSHQHDSVIDITKWAQEYFQKPLSVNTIRHLQMPTKALNMVQKRRCVLWAKAHLKWTVSKWKIVLWSDESKFDILVGNNGRRVLQAKEEGDLPACYQHSVQKPASLMVWGCISAYGMGSLHVLEGTVNAERYIKVLEQHMLHSRQRVFQQDNAKPHILQLLQQHGFIVEESGCWIGLPAVQIFHL